MKKKILFATLSCLLLFSGVVSAANLWGTYKGNQIIRLTVNGDPVKVTDVPAISYNGRTMIPIYLLNNAGINYYWDQKNQTVDITSKVTEKNNDRDIVSKVKIMNYYKGLEEVGDRINSVIDAYEIVFNRYMYGTNQEVNIQTANDALNGAIDFYNLFQKNSHSIISLDYLNTSEINSILNNYYDAIELLKISYTSLEKLSINYTQKEYGNYYSNGTAALALIDKGLRSSSNSYFSLFNLITK